MDKKHVIVFFVAFVDLIVLEETCLKVEPSCFLVMLFYVSFNICYLRILYHTPPAMSSPCFKRTALAGFAAICKATSLCFSLAKMLLNDFKRLRPQYFFHHLMFQEVKLCLKQVNRKRFFYGK